MGDTTSFLLPPGTRFYPSDQQLICNYLSSKNNTDHCNDFKFNLIQEIDLYNFDPFNLPGSACFKYGRGSRKRHWFCFVARVLKGGKRRAGGGYWKNRGRVRDVVGAGTGKVVVGTRKSFVFYLGDCTKTGVKTDWLMYEYALTGHPMASFVLCRVFTKSRGVYNLSEHVFSFCGEDTVARVRHVGIQYDGTAASVADSKVHDENTIDQENDVSKLPSGLVTDLNGQALTEHVAQQTGVFGSLIGNALGDIVRVDGLSIVKVIGTFWQTFWGKIKSQHCLFCFSSLVILAIALGSSLWRM